MAERNRPAAGWGGVKADYPEDKCIHHLFEACAEAAPEEIAVVFEGERITYGEFNRRSNQLARRLKRLGAGPDVLIGICMERSLDMVIGMMGILKAGGAYVPLDPAYPIERLTFMRGDSQVAVLVTQEKCAKRLGFAGHVVSIDGDREEIGREDGRNFKGETVPDNLAYVMYTSGSTGKPKGVLVTHRNVVGFLHSFSLKVINPDGLRRIGTTVAPFSFDTSVEEIFSTLCFGGTLHIIRREHSTDADYFARYLIDQHITTAYIVPDLIAEVAHCLQMMSAVINLKCVITGLAPKRESVLQKMRDVSSALLIVNAYGPTEVTYGATAFEFHRASEADRDVPIGRAFPNYEVYIVDADLRPVGVGEPGELLIGGIGLSKGYLNRPDLTVKKFIRNPFVTEAGARLYRTGDLCRYLPDGNIEFLGRVDDQIKIRGFRVEPGEIKTVLMGQRSVGGAAVIAAADGSGNRRLVAYVVLKPGEKRDVHELKSYLKGKLPDYMLPSLFIFLDALPLQPNGKIDREALPVPDFSERLSKEVFICPSTPEEELIAGIWTEVLGMRNVGVNDNLFELGGHSLSAAKILARIRETFSADLRLQTVFEKPTVAGLAQEVKSGIFEKGESLPPIEHARKDQEIPLSFSQERIWFINELHPGILAYNFQSALRFKGALDTASLERSLNEIVRRHEIYRTSFPSRDGRPLQVIHEYCPFTLETAEVAGLGEEDREREVMKIIAGAYRHQFDLSSLPLVRWKLLRLNPEEHVLIHVEHHLVHDGWSFNIFLGALKNFYNAISSGKPLPLAEPRIQFADFACWQRQWMEGEIVGKQLAYWKRHLNGYREGIDLPLDHPRPPVQTFRGRTDIVDLSPELCETLRSFSRANGVTLYMTMLSAFFILLYRYSGKADLCVGAGIANRRTRESEEVMGMIINTVALRADLSGDPPVREFLRLVRAVCLGAYANQDIPFDRVVDAMRPDRSLSHSPLYQVMFSFHDAPLCDLDFHGLHTELIEGLSQTAKFDLSLVAIPRPEQNIGNETTAARRGITLLWEYNSDLFDPSTIARLREHYESVLEQMPAGPDRRVSELPLLTDADRHRIMVEWNDTASPYPEDKCVHHLFEEQVQRTPDAVAVVCENRSLTYGQLNSDAERVARGLRALGVGPDVPVGIFVERSADMIVGILGILKAGGAYVPLDPSYPPDRLSLMVQDAQVRVLLTQRGLSESAPSGIAGALCIDAEINIPEESPRDTASSAPGDLVYVMYTSGSTGRPKGIQIEHRSVVNLLTGIARETGFAEHDTFLSVTSLSFDVSVAEIFLPLTVGARLVVAGSRVVSDAVELARLIADSHTTVMIATPATWQMLVISGWRGEARLNIISTGDTLSRELSAQLVERCSCLWNLYGPTEATVWSSLHRIREKNDPVLAGRPIANTQIYIVDSRLRPVPVGAVGELYIGGDGLARGYLNHSELTAERFIPDPFGARPGARLHKTGDLARFHEDGTIEVLGRIDDQVKVRGFRIELEEIEAVLGRHPSVGKTVVAVREYRPGEKQIVAYVIPAGGGPLHAGELRRFLKEKLPGYMIPSAFVPIGEIPLTPSGKRDRRALPGPWSLHDMTEDGFVAPRNPLEKRVADIMSSVLGVERVGVNDSFFDLGGHSLLATQIVSRLRDALNAHITLRSIFDAPTVEELSALIGAVSEDTRSERPHEGKKGRYNAGEI